MNSACTARARSHVDATFFESSDSTEHGFCITTLKKIRDQDNVALGRVFDLLFAVREGGVDVGSASKLDTEEHADGVVELGGQVEHRGVEADELCGQPGE